MSKCWVLCVSFLTIILESLRCKCRTSICNDSFRVVKRGFLFRQPINYFNRTSIFCRVEPPKLGKNINDYENIIIPLSYRCERTNVVYQECQAVLFSLSISHTFLLDFELLIISLSICAGNTINYKAWHLYRISLYIYTR